MLASIASAVVHGYQGKSVSIEVHVSNGLPGYTIVGLPDAACREARDRVRAAMLSTGFKWPQKKVTINLAPSSLRKEGGSLDLAIALALLTASGQIPPEATENLGAIGELGLDGSLKPVPGLICLAGSIQSKRLVVPAAGASESAVTFPNTVHSATSLHEVVGGLLGHSQLDIVAPPDGPQISTEESYDMSEYLGQTLARKALEISAAGGHHLLLVGPPGAGKTMLAKRLPGLLPDLDDSDSLTVSKIHSAAGIRNFDTGPMRRPPFRAPHHGASMAGLLGGGTGLMRPGEISCAHAGVLFLDEMGEYKPSLLDSLRTPLEEGVIRVSRAANSEEFPARFILVGSMNPCPCGGGTLGDACHCSTSARRRYARRLSGPVMDRFDLRVEIAPPDPDHFFDKAKSESSESIAERVQAARAQALRRSVRFNAELGSSELDKHTVLSDQAEALLVNCLKAGTISARGVVSLRRVALTLSDLNGESDKGSVRCLSKENILTALGMRSAVDSVFEGLADA